MRRRLSRSGDSPLRRWRRLILALLGGLLAVQALTLGLFAISTWRSNASQSKEFVDQAVSAASISAADQIHQLVVDFESAVNLSAQLADEGVIPGDIDRETERYLLKQLNTQPAISAAYLGMGNGQFLMASRDTSKPGFSFRVKRIQTVGKRSVTLRWLNANMQVGLTEQIADDTYDPRARPWYQAATTSKGVIWTDPYIFFTSRQPGLTVATETARLHGVKRVIGMDFGIENLGAFARQIKVGPSGSTIITAGDGSVIAAPDLDQRITEDRDGKPVLPHLDAFPAPIPALAAPMERAQVGAVLSISEVGSGSGKTAVAVTKVPVGKGVWSVALYGPASEFATSATQTGRRGLVKIILLGVLALCLAVILAAALTRPLGGLALSAASDGLTGLANRRELESVGVMLFQRAQAGARMLSVAIVDVDKFKEINDTHGHLVGDDVLRTIADALTAAVRRDDVVGRFAGDEFVIVMPDAGGPEAQAVANRALQAVREFPLNTRVTASAGVATLTKAHATFSDLLEASDRALYRAKQLGRDRVVREGDLSVPAKDD